MRHGNAGRKFGRSHSHRNALFRNMVSSLLLHDRIETTHQKAKELRPIVERLISLGREDSVAARRRAAAYLRGKEPVQRLFDVVGPRFVNRPGGYTRILATRFRSGDSAPMALLELVEQG
ncbi:MAG: 50S ribosomal protein L17 [Nitrospirota bacterium]|nr:50S ribosomal protein L17 [Nitrospirota bacterium]